MPDLPPITRPNGKTYRPRVIKAYSWDNEETLGRFDEYGAVVLGTHDVDRARPLATEAIRRWFNGDEFATKPEVGWFRLGYQNGELTWLRDEVTGRAGVMFTADYEEDESA